MDEVQNYSGAYDDSFIKIRDIEDKQKLIKDRLILIGDNLIKIKEKNQLEINEIKKEMEILKSDMNRLKDFLETLSAELPNFARKQDVEILKKQAIMFQPLERLK